MNKLLSLRILVECLLVFETLPFHVSFRMCKELVTEIEPGFCCTQGQWQSLHEEAGYQKMMGKVSTKHIGYVVELSKRITHTGCPRLLISSYSNFLSIENFLSQQ